MMTLLILLSGCNGSPVGTSKVTGNVTYNGTPVAKGSIIFQPAEAKGAPASTAITEGKYTINVVPAKYKITVSAPPEAASTGPMTYENYKKFDAREMARLSKAEREKRIGNPGVPEDAGGNNVTFEIKGEQSVDINLTKPSK